MVHIGRMLYPVAALVTVSSVFGCGGQNSDSLPSASTSMSPASATNSPTRSPIRVNGYLETTDSHVLFLLINGSAGYVGGQASEATADWTVPSGMQGKSAQFNAQLAGSVVGSAVQIDLGGVLWTGQITVGGMTLLVPDSSGRLVSRTFRSATSDDYNAAVSTLGGSVVAARSSATASASAATATAAAGQQRRADANATAIAVQRATVEAAKLRSCVATGGHIATKADTAIPEGWCASNIKGNPSGMGGSDCSFAGLPFNGDGTIRTSAYETSKDFYPGCFN